MSPSLNELAGMKAAAGESGFEDAEDMYGQKLTFNDNEPVQNGWKVKVIGVDMDAGTHEVKLPSGTIRTISNDADVYEAIE